MLPELLHAGFSLNPSSYIPFQWMAPSITTSAKPEIQELLRPPRSSAALQPMCHESVYCNWRPFQPGLVPLLHHPSPSSPHEIWIPWGPGCPACSQCLEQCMAHSRRTFKSFWMNEWSSLPSQTLLNTTIMIFPNLLRSQRSLAYNSPVLLTLKNYHSPNWSSVVLKCMVNTACIIS